METINKNVFRILLVEKDISTSMLLEHYFKERRYLHKNISNITQLTKMLDENNFNIAIVDISSLENEAEDWCNILKIRSNHSEMPLILLTTDFAEEAEKKLKLYNADEFLLRPCSFEDLDKIILNFKKN